MIRLPKHLGRIARRAGCIGTTGTLKTTKAGNMRFRSMLEAKFIKALDDSKNVTKFYAEPFGIPYQVKAGTRVYNKKYKPDFLVEYADGTRDVFEIKPASQKGWALNKAKWSHAKPYLEKMGIGFHIIDDKMLGGKI